MMSLAVIDVSFCEIAEGVILATRCEGGFACVRSRSLSTKAPESIFRRAVDGTLSNIQSFFLKFTNYSMIIRISHMHSLSLLSFFTSL